MTINIELIRKYINGEELDDNTINKLENDKDFMMNVFNYTKDCNIYKLCSDNLKKDYDFVKYLVLKFKDNYNFIIEVADYYLNNTDKQSELLELNIIMEKLLPKELSKKYTLINETKYSYERFTDELASLDSPEYESTIEMGFPIILYKYHDSEYILDYYAKKMIKEIMDNTAIEEILHNQFKTPNSLKNMGINNYIITLLNYNDSMLSSYVSTHLYLIDDMVKQIEQAIDNWDKYDSKNEMIRYNKMIDMVHEYLSTVDTNMEEIGILFSIGRKLNITNTLIKYYYGNNKELEEFDIELFDEFELDLIEDEINNNLGERKIYDTVKRIMIDQLFSKEPVDLYTIIDNNKKKIKMQKRTSNKVNPK